MAPDDRSEASVARDSDPGGAANSINAQVSRAIIRLLAEYTGRGPTKARTTINGSLLVCLVEDTLTKGEKVLVANGQREAVLRMRESYQQAMSREATAIVEELTGRKVLAFMSSNHADPDYGAEIFILDGTPTTPSG